MADASKIVFHVPFL
jgi:hypothetical protein